MNVAEGLSREVERVVILREKYRHASALQHAMVGEMPEPWPDAFAPTVAVMTEAIEAAHAAAGSGEALDVVRSFETLKGFTA